MTKPTTPPVLNIDDVLATQELVDTNPRRGQFESRMGAIGRALDTKGIGINVTVVPPGRKAWPRHYHYVNDEMFIVLNGTGTLHFGDDDHPVKPRDIIYIRGGTGIPFQLENTGTEELEYLGLSTMIPGDVFHYVDSGKYGVMAAGTPFRVIETGGLPKFTRFIHGDMSAAYWDGEPDAQD
ncbi:MAG: cupin domain-containing protein [Pseudomonadota bacterium]